MFLGGCDALIPFTGCDKARDGRIKIGWDRDFIGNIFRCIGF